MSENLNPDKALIFRIVHRANIPWILEHGMYCQNSHNQDENYRTIGNPELIDRRRRRVVPISPGGTLSDYIPFYFTPYSPMMYNIKTGYAGITKVPNDEVVIFVSSLHRLNEMGISFVFTDRHACLVNAEFYNDVDGLHQIDWRILQTRDFRRDPDDPEKMERYQAEALVQNYLPVEALIGLVCYTDQARDQISQLAINCGLDLKVVKKTGWYF
jgi:hypothetical protein